MGNIFFYQTDIGKIGIIENGIAITHVYFNEEAVLQGAIEKETELLKEAGRQLLEYLAGKRKVFELALAPMGTVFQQKVWNCLLRIPYGETQSYGEVAKHIAQPTASRAVGMANNKNPIPIFIPCHRVIGTNGKLVGYAGGLKLKEHLLNLEKRENGLEVKGDAVTLPIATDRGVHEAVREKLLALAEEKYQIFSAGLIPNVDGILGVRQPLLRKMAKEIAKGDWRTYVRDVDKVYFEEIMLQGMALGYVEADIEEILSYMAQFIPRINNWAVCDSFCNSLKVTKVNKERVWAFLQSYLASNQEYEIRFAVVMLIEFYIEETYIDRILVVLDAIKHDGYYVKMAVAWALSICYVKLPVPTMVYLKNNTLDNQTYNKTLQKITESQRVMVETKTVIRSMKRK